MWDDESDDADRMTRGFLAYRIERVHARLTSQSSRILAAHCGLTSRQWWIIADMMAEAPRTSTELARIADIDKGLLSRNLAALQTEGLVKLERDFTDRRQLLISLTEKGRALHDRTLPVMQARNNALTQDMTAEDVSLLLTLLDKIETAAADTNFGDGAAPRAAAPKG